MNNIRQVAAKDSQAIRDGGLECSQEIKDKAELLSNIAKCYSHGVCSYSCSAFAGPFIQLLVSLQEHKLLGSRTEACQSVGSV